MDVLETVISVEDKSLEYIKQAQDLVLDAARSAVDTVAPVIPDVGPLPFADQLPELSDVVANAYDFAGKLLATSRTFTEQLVEALAPLALTASTDAPVIATAKPAPKAKAVA